MGSVYKARQPMLDRLVAIKILPPKLAKDAEYIARFFREARAAGKLSHPNIVAGIDVGEADGYYYFAMEYVEGEPLSAVLKREGRLPERRAVEIARQVAEGLRHAHEHDIIHRDIKPENILLDASGTAKVCDLGLARSASGDDISLTQTGTAVGTPYYLSPEQARGDKDLDDRTDVYSLGATLFRMVAGRPPFDGPTAAVVMTKHLSEHPPPLREIVPEISDGLAAVVARTLEKRREDRYASMGELIEDLDRVLAGEEPVAARGRMRAGGRRAREEGMVAARAGRAAPDRATVSGAPAGLAGGRGTAVFLAAAGVALAAGIGAYALLAGGGGPPPRDAGPRPPEGITGKAGPPTDASPVRPVPPAEEARRLFEAARDFQRDNPNDLAGAIARFERARDAAPGTEYARMAGEAAAALAARRDAAAAAIRQAAGDAGALAAKGDYDGAAAVWRKAWEDAGEAARPEMAKAIAALRGEAEARLTAAMDEADRCAAEKRFADAIRALDAVKDVVYRDWEDRLRAARAKIEAAEKEAETARRAEAAEAALAKYADVFVAALIGGDGAAAKKAADEAAADPALKGLPEEAGAASKVRGMTEVCDALARMDAARLAALEKLKDGAERTFETVRGTVKGAVSRAGPDEIAVRIKIPGAGGAFGEQKIRLADLTPESRKALALDGGFTPATPAERIAASARAIAAGDIESAGSMLEAAKDHWLAPACRRKLDEKLLGAAEASAKAAWEAIARAAGTGKIPDARAKELGERLAAFEKEHGGTKFAAGIKVELDALKDRLAQAGGGWRTIRPADLETVLKGQAKASTEGDTLVLDIPPGPGNNVRIYPLRFAKDFRLSLEFSGELIEMELRKVNWHGCILMLIGRDMYRARTYPADDPHSPQQLAGEKRPGILGPGWHRLEIAASGRSFSATLDGAALCAVDDLPAVARGDISIFGWPAHAGQRLQIRNVRVSVPERDVSQGVFDGIFMANGQGNNWVDFKADGEDVSRRYPLATGADGTPDRAILDVLQKVFSLNRGRVSWRLVNGQPVATAVEIATPKEQSGTLIGVLTFNQNNCIEVKPDSGPPERFIPRWMGGHPSQGGGLDRQMVAALTRFKVGDRVRVSWIYETRKRVVGIEPAP
ncbi:MAG: serine/threonine protein kinase, partial [Planctomycetota bacterium]|nr:serine/threonine protein kinase [Planctomycetota bacterium]